MNTIYEKPREILSHENFFFSINNEEVIQPTREQWLRVPPKNWSWPKNVFEKSLPLKLDYVEKNYCRFSNHKVAKVIMKIGGVKTKYVPTYPQYRMQSTPIYLV